MVKDIENTDWLKGGWDQVSTTPGGLVGEGERDGREGGGVRVVRGPREDPPGRIEFKIIVLHCNSHNRPVTHTHTIILPPPPLPPI